MAAERNFSGVFVRVETLASSWISAYGQIYFSRRLLSGLLFCAATFVVPFQGAAGLAGLVLANLFARWIGQPAEQY